MSLPTPEFSYWAEMDSVTPDELQRVDALLEEWNMTLEERLNQMTSELRPEGGRPWIAALRRNAFSEGKNGDQVAGERWAQMFETKAAMAGFDAALVLVDPMQRRYFPEDQSAFLKKVADDNTRIAEGIRRESSQPQ